MCADKSVDFDLSSEITGFSLQSHNVDTSAQDLELPHEGEKTVKVSEFTNLYSLQKVPTHVWKNRPIGGPNDSFPT